MLCSGIVLLLTSALAAASPTFDRIDAAPQIINGQAAQESDFPWLVSLRYYKQSKLWRLMDDSRKFCTGSLIAPQWVLTAAHCVHGEPMTRLARWEVKLGSMKVDSSIGERLRSFVDKLFGLPGEHFHRRVAKIAVHPAYDVAQVWLHDIALIKLNQPVDVPLLPLPLNVSEAFPGADSKCLTAGWGCNQEGASYSNKAHYLEMPVLPISRCVTLYRDLHETTQQYRVCAGYFLESKSTCNGDSGGALVCPRDASQPGSNLVQAGITSFGSKSSQHNYPTVFTRVSKYVDWIRRTMATQ